MRRLRRKTKPPSEKYLKLARRRAAVRALNAVAEELQLGVSPLKTKETDAGVVTRRIRLLEPRCQERIGRSHSKAAALPDRHVSMAMVTYSGLIMSGFSVGTQTSCSSMGFAHASTFVLP